MTTKPHAALLVVMLPVSLLFAAVWVMSPVGVGFADWPDDPARKTLARTVYLVSYWVGLPVLAFGQVLGLIRAVRGRPGQGLAVSAGSFSLAFGSAVLFMSLMP